MVRREFSLNVHDTDCCVMGRTLHVGHSADISSLFGLCVLREYWFEVRVDNIQRRVEVLPWLGNEGSGGRAWVTVTCTRYSFSWEGRPLSVQGT